MSALICCLVILGFLLLVVEAHVPTYGALGAAGIAAVVAGLVLLVLGSGASLLLALALAVPVMAGAGASAPEPQIQDHASLRRPALQCRSWRDWPNGPGAWSFCPSVLVVAHTAQHP